MNTSQVGTIDYFPTKKFMVTYDSASLVASGAITPQMMNQLDTIRWEYKGQAIEKANLMILDLLATNNWKRPVYFVSTTGADTYIGLYNYLNLEGLAYRLLPVKAVSSDQQTGKVNTDVMYDNVMNRFKWGNMNKPGVYIDEANARMIMNMRGMFGRLADALILEGKMDSARRVVERCFEIMPESVAEFDLFTVPVIDAMYRLGETSKANDLASKLLKSTDEKLTHMFTFSDKDIKSLDMNIQEGIFTIQRIGLAVHNANQKFLIDQAEPLMKKYYDLYVARVYQQ
jgi:hypothetical protein